MSGRRAIPQPGTPRLVTARSGRYGQYRPRVQAIESPMTLTRGSGPGRRPGRAIGGGCRAGAGLADAEGTTGRGDGLGARLRGAAVLGYAEGGVDPARANAAATATAAPRTRTVAG